MRVLVYSAALERVRVIENPQRRFYQDLKIELDRPAAQVLQVIQYARFHLVECPRLASQSVDLRPLLGQITCPALIVAGELDFICGPAQARPIAAAIPGSQLIMLAGCGHLPSIEAPQESRRAGGEFFRG